MADSGDNLNFINLRITLIRFCFTIIASFLVPGFCQSQELPGGVFDQICARLFN